MTIILFDLNYFTTTAQFYGNCLPKHVLRLNPLYALRSYLTAHNVMAPRHLAEKFIRRKVFCQISIRTWQ